MKQFFFVGFTPLLLYVFLTVIPNKWGCLLPVKYCLIGSNKFVDILTISAYLIPIFLLLGAYQLWRKQKCSEIIANEAKEIFMNMQEIEKLRTLLQSYIYDGFQGRVGEIEEFIKLKHLVVETRLKSGVLTILLKEENGKYVNEVGTFGDMIWEFGSILKRNEFIDLATDHRASNVRDDIMNVWFNRECEILANILPKIILHKF